MVIGEALMVPSGDYEVVGKEVLWIPRRSKGEIAEAVPAAPGG